MTQKSVYLFPLKTPLGSSRYIVLNDPERLEEGMSHHDTLSEALEEYSRALRMGLSPVIAQILDISFKVEIT